MSTYTIKGETGEWEVVIGLEVHAQITTNAKLFSGAATAFGAEPNTQVSLVDAAMPGTHGRGSIAKIISMPTCRRDIRFHSFIIRLSAKAR